MYKHSMTALQRLLPACSCLYINCLQTELWHNSKSPLEIHTCYGSIVWTQSFVLFAPPILSAFYLPPLPKTQGTTFSLIYPCRSA
jgi:hypothetical protein